MDRLRAGDAVGFPAGTGVSHTFINNTDREVRLLVVGEAGKAENRIHYPLNEAYAAGFAKRWVDHEPRALGPHDGRPDHGDGDKPA